MAEEKFMLISLEDEKAKKLADALGNKTCKKIISLLAESAELSEKDISEELKIPINTVEYNLKKLLDAKLIEKSKNFFWSKKGRKIDMYKLSNKSIVISPKGSNVSSKLKSILPSVLIVGASTFAVYVYERISSSKQVLQSVVESATPSAANAFYSVGATDEVAKRVVGDGFMANVSPLWIWFLGGALLALLIISIVNWRKL